MKLVRFAQAAVFAVSLTIAGVAFGADAQGYIQTNHTSMTSLLNQPASAAREQQIANLLDGMIDYDELVRRSFGATCPLGLTSCTDHWKDLNDAQKAEVTGLVKKLVQKNYKKNLSKTLEFEIAYTGSNNISSGDIRVKTEAKSKVKTRDPAVQIDYIVKPNGSSFKVVDIVTEGSSLSKNYYTQFHKFLTTPDQGYAHIVKKLNAKINEA